MAALLFELPEVVGSSGFSFSPALLCDWHWRLFGGLFPDDAGRLRWRRDEGWEHVFFGGNVGTRKSRRIKEYRGTHPRRLPRRMREICDEFDAERGRLIGASPDPVSIDDSAHTAARLYVKLLRAHPWIDGNLRVSYVALQAALISLDLPPFGFSDLEQHDDLVGRAFRGRNEPYRPLARHVAGGSGH
jgi:fido (protein-threonine AMPylation protein)